MRAAGEGFPLNTTDFVILLAEDDKDHVVLMQRALQKANLANPLLVVRDGEEAIQYLDGRGEFSDRRQYPLPSLLFLDLKMPKRQGLEVLGWLRGDPRFRRLPVVILTSSIEAVDIQNAYALGVDSYLVKPVQVSVLVELVKAIGMYRMLPNRSPIFPGALQPGGFDKAEGLPEPKEKE